MRSDQTLSVDGFAESAEWKHDAVAECDKPEIDVRFERGGVEDGGNSLRHSFSGYERNCWFHNMGDGGFTDLSALSGLDNVADGRAHVVWHFDRDGWLDVALVNANDLDPWCELRRGLTGDRHESFVAVLYPALEDGDQPKLPGGELPHHPVARLSILLACCSHVSNWSTAITCRSRSSARAMQRITV